MSDSIAVALTALWEQPQVKQAMRFLERDAAHTLEQQIALTSIEARPLKKPRALHTSVSFCRRPDCPMCASMPRAMS
jgi:Mn-containing catalase